MEFNAFHGCFYLSFTVVMAFIYLTASVYVRKSSLLLILAEFNVII